MKEVVYPKQVSAGHWRSPALQTHRLAAEDGSPSSSRHRFESGWVYPIQLKSNASQSMGVDVTVLACAAGETGFFSMFARNDSGHLAGAPQEREAKSGCH
jgi:hypothetical protein